MKTFAEYMSLDYRVKIIEDKKEGGFTVYYPELPGCITCGDTITEAIENAVDAKKAWIEAALEDGIKIPEPDNTGICCERILLQIP